MQGFAGSLYCSKVYHLDDEECELLLKVSMIFAGQCALVNRALDCYSGDMGSIPNTATDLLSDLVQVASPLFMGLLAALFSSISQGWHVATEQI